MKVGLALTVSNFTTLIKEIALLSNMFLKFPVTNLTCSVIAEGTRTVLEVPCKGRQPAASGSVQGPGALPILALLGRPVPH